LADADPDEPVAGTRDLKISRDRAKRVTKCVRRCPGVECRSNEPCPEDTDREASPCWDYVHEERIREVNPVAIVGIALGAAALTAFTVALVTGRISFPTQ
jgi:hypothetical protein